VIGFLEYGEPEKVYRYSTYTYRIAARFSRAIKSLAPTYYWVLRIPNTCRNIGIRVLIDELLIMLIIRAAGLLSQAVRTPASGDVETRN
jgi:hypothetical protein